MNLSRRKFLQAGGSMLIYFSLGQGPALAQPARGTGLPADLRRNPQLDAWLSLDSNGSVTVFTGKCELGQGVETAFAQIAAEELQVEFKRVIMTRVDTRFSPDQGITAGSMSVERGGAALRQAAAEIRQRLITLAAERLGRETDVIAVRDGRFYIGDQPAGLDYWQLLDGRRLQYRATGTARPVPAASHKIVGRSQPRLDIPGKATGEESFLHDIRLPGMVHARLVTPPRPGAMLEQVDTGAALELPGVSEVIHRGSFLAVVAGREEQAVRAADTLLAQCRWGGGRDLPDAEKLTAWLQNAGADVAVVAESGTPEPGTDGGLTATYSRPFQAHASLSPSIAIALYEGEQLTVWSHAQGMFPLRGALAGVTGLAEAKIRCIHVHGSGCYGHNGADDAACDAALIALRVPGRTVRLQYSRADEFLREPYGSAMAMQVSATLDEHQRIRQWDYHVWSCTHSTRPVGARGAGNMLSAGLIGDSPGGPAAANIPLPSGGAERNAVPLYEIPNMRITEHFVRDMPLRVSALRTLGAYGNVFALESFMDELALQAGADPLDFRLAHLRDERAVEVLETLGRLTRWTRSTGRGDGTGRGIGFARYKNASAYCAVMMEVTVDRQAGGIRPLRAVAVTDAGQIINPDGLRNQIEGGIIQSASWTLKEQVQFTREAIQSRDWSGYPILRFSETPVVEVELIDRPGSPPLGAGEAAQGPAAAALANAVFYATGSRLRDIPFTPERLQSARG